MKKHSMRILGLLLFVCVAFVQDSFSQDFKPMSEAQSAVQVELDGINNSFTGAIKVDASISTSVKLNERRYYTAFLERLGNSTSTEDAYTATNATWSSLNLEANWSSVMDEMSSNLLSLISE